MKGEGDMGREPREWHKSLRCTIPREHSSEAQGSAEKMEMGEDGIYSLGNHKPVGLQRQ